MGFISLIFGALIFHSVATDVEPAAMAQARQSPELSVYRAVVDTMRVRYPTAPNLMIFVDTLTVPSALVSLELARAIHARTLTEPEMRECAHFGDACPLPQDSAATLIHFYSSRLEGSTATVTVAVTSALPFAPDYFRAPRRFRGSTTYAVTLKRSRDDWTVTSMVATVFAD